MVGGFANAAAGCLNCVPGRYSEIDHYLPDAGIPACTACEAGMWSLEKGATDGNTCHPCPVGTYSKIIAAATNATETCISCPVGTFNHRVARSSEIDCLLCPAGFASKHLASGTCFKCLKGYRSDQGATVCSICGKGRYISETGHGPDKCLSAPLGKFVSKGSASTLDVPLGFRGSNCTELENTPDAKGCIEMKLCHAGSFGVVKNEGTTGGGTCTNCPIVGLI